MYKCLAITIDEEDSCCSDEIELENREAANDPCKVAAAVRKTAKNPNGCFSDLVFPLSKVLVVRKSRNNNLPIVIGDHWWPDDEDECGPGHCGDPLHEL